MAAPSRTRRLLLNLLRLLLTVGAFYLVSTLIHFDDYDVAKLPDGSFRPMPREGDPPLPAGAVVETREGFLSLFRRMDRRAALILAPLLLLPTFLISVRWWWLLRVAGASVSLTRVFYVSYAGTFFNLILPGAVGGDLAKAALAVQGEERKAAIVGTVLLDRVIGLLVMVGMATVAVIPQITNPRLRQPVVLILSLALGFVVGYFVYFNRTLRQTKLAVRLKSLLPFPKVLLEIDEVFHSIRGAKGVLWKSVLITLLSQSILITVVYGLGYALGIREATLAQFFLFEPILFILTSIPTSPGSWGVAEYFYALLFGLVGVPENQAIALSVLYKLALMAISLPGGLVFAMGLAERKRSQR